MKESVSNDLIHMGINFGIIMFFIGVLYGVVRSIMQYYNNNYANHDHGNNNNNDHVIISIMELSGIEPSILRSIPIVDFISQDYKDGNECVVCLSELVDGDKVMVLPSCNHLFHAECIGSWLRSHSTCPICRMRVGLVQKTTRPDLGDEENLTQNQDSVFETNHPPSTDTTFVVGGEINDGRADITAVVVDVPAKTS